MMIAEAEKLKKLLTDKYVVVNQSVPELRRFVGLTGRVKTVNMNCRALVEFDGPVDISWYDIDPAFLTVVEAPQPKSKEAHEEPKAEQKAPPKPAGGKSPLEMARQQGAAGASTAGGDSGKKLSPLELARQQGAGGKAKPADDSGKKLSPLEQARLQGAAGKSASTESAQVAANPGKLSPLELARQQGAAKKAAEAASAPVVPAEITESVTVSEAAPEAVSEPEPPATVAESSQSTPAASSGAATPGSTAEIIALARNQGAFKG